ncbi:hypothetical protein F5879DRAFT_927958 [Lentinula edodes]|nr:hypothetical protein F5879DRAFT_927958 [Lentinula edodes]
MPVFQHSPDVPHPFPRARSTAALRAENETLRAEVADLCKLLETSRAETSMLTSLLWDTTTSLDDRNKDLEASRRALQNVTADRVEYSHVLAQFRAIEAELLEAPLEDALTRFHLAVAAVDSYREVAIRQKQEISELREQVDKEQKHSFEAHEELDAANARAIHLRDRLEDLKETVHRYRARAHVAKELIRKYPEDEGLIIDGFRGDGYVDARRDSLEPPLHRRLFSFGHLIPLSQSPISDHIPAVPMMDSVMLMWEDMIRAYMRKVLGYPASPDRVSSPVEVAGSNDPLPTTSSLIASDTRPVLDASVPVSRDALLFLPGSLSPTSSRSPSPIPSSSCVPHVPREVVNLTMDDAEDLYEMQEEFLARTGGAVTVKQENTESDVVFVEQFYRHLVARIHLLESQLATSQRENSSLTSALWDTSLALESRQREVEQLRSSSREVLECEMEDCRILDQFPALDEALPGALGQLMTTLLHQQGLVDELNALATRQRRLVEELQEEVHRVCGRAVFIEQMLKEYPVEGYYEVVLPLSFAT